MITVYPQYFDKNLTLSEGRKVPEELAVKEPTLNEVIKALKKLKLQYTVEKGKSYPGKWYEKSGRVLVENKTHKRETLKEIAEKLNEIKN